MADWFGFRHGGKHGTAAFWIRDRAEEFIALFLSVGVEIMPLHDALGIASLEGGVADGAVGGDVVTVIFYPQSGGLSGLDAELAHQSLGGIGLKSRDGLRDTGLA